MKLATITHYHVHMTLVIFWSHGSKAKM